MKKIFKILLNVLAVGVIAFALVLLVYKNDGDFSQWEISISELLAEVIQDDKEAALTDGTLSILNDTTEYIEIENTEPAEGEQPGYIELYGLEEVDKPEKRNAQEVLQKLEELSEEYELVRAVYENVDLYSEEMLANLADNPEMAAYVLGLLESDGSVTGGFTRAELEAENPLLLQYDPRWGYFEYGGKPMGITGCGPTCLAMAILQLTDETTVTPDKIAEYSMENGYYVNSVGTAWKLLDQFPTLYGLTVEHPAITEENIKKALDNGDILICSVKKGEFTAGGHFIVIYGYDENGFKVNDPKCVARSRRTWTYREFGDQIKRIWSIGQENGE